MAEATIVSLVPRKIREFKPGLDEPHFEMEPADITNGDFEIKVVKDRATSIYLDNDRGSRRFPVPVEEYAESIVNDFRLAQIERSSETGAEPGIFWLPGRVTKEEVKTKHKDVLAAAIKAQTLWFERLVRKADDDWNQSRQVNRIAEIQRIAAKVLNLSRDWLYEDMTMGNATCPACSSVLPNPVPVLCPICKLVLDETKYKTFKFATTG